MQSQKMTEVGRKMGIGQGEKKKDLLGVCDIDLGNR